MKRIYIKHLNRVVAFTVDDEDFNRVTTYKWCLSGNNHIMRYTKGKNPLGVYLHHFLIGQPLKPRQTDHIDRNPLNNCKTNLRHVSRAMNSINRNIRSDNTSGKTGVFYDCHRKQWRALGYNEEYLGRFNTKQRAIEVRRAYENSSKV